MTNRKLSPATVTCQGFHENSFSPIDSSGQSIHLAEGLTSEDKRLFLGARLRLLYRKLSRNLPIAREELAGLVPYAYGTEAEENGVAA